LYKNVKKQKRQPILVAKKIHGILFPFFKSVSVLGVNIYSTLVNKKIIELTNGLKNEATLSDNYNERIGDLADFVDNIKDEHYEDNLIKKIFKYLYQNILKIIIKIF